MYIYVNSKTGVNFVAAYHDQLASDITKVFNQANSYVCTCNM